MSASQDQPKPKKAPASDPTHAKDDWQTAFVWSFIVKFHPTIIGKGGLSNVMDLEIGLMATEPDDALSFVFQKMVAALRNGNIRDMSKTTMPKYLFRVVDEYLQLSPWSTYHTFPRHPDSLYESVLGMTPVELHQHAMGLNPLRVMMSDAVLDEDEDDAGPPLREGSKEWEEKAGSMVWQMSWKDKLRLLRQLCDWQLCHSKEVRDAITIEYNVANHQSQNHNPLTNKLMTVPVTQDRNKRRYWSLDDSPRIYTSTNPYKKNCPLTPITSTKEELLALSAELRELNDYRVPARLPGEPEPAAVVESPKKKVKGESKKDKKEKSKGHEGEIKLIKFIEEEHLPKVDREVARQEAARKKAQKQAIMQAQAESYMTRSTRTRKTVDYKALDNGTAYASAGASSDEDAGSNSNSDNEDYSNPPSESSRRQPARSSTRTGTRSSNRSDEPASGSTRRSSRRGATDEEERALAEALEQSAREAEMSRAMAGGLNGKEEDDEEDEVVGTLKKKSGQVIESDDEMDDSDGDDAPHADVMAKSTPAANGTAPEPPTTLAVPKLEPKVEGAGDASVVLSTSSTLTVESNGADVKVEEVKAEGGEDVKMEVDE